jgi:hypothetical protein
MADFKKDAHVWPIQAHSLTSPGRYALTLSTKMTVKSFPAIGKVRYPREAPPHSIQNLVGNQAAEKKLSGRTVVSSDFATVSRSMHTAQEASCTSEAVLCTTTSSARHSDR